MYGQRVTVMSEKNLVEDLVISMALESQSG
jgi:hypothetical protein